ncbi:MAG TPA: hypothetical protein VGG15_08200, partial [Terriglobales bacterium]
AFMPHGTTWGLPRSILEESSKIAKQLCLPCSGYLRAIRQHSEQKANYFYNQQLQFPISLQFSWGLEQKRSTPML